MSNIVNTISHRYNLPQNDTEAINKLAKVLDLPSHYIHGDNNKIAIALAGAIMYRQLPRLEKITVMQSIAALSYRPLVGQLVAKCTDPMLQPQWGEWSMTNQELEEVLLLHNSFNRWSSILGANPGAYGVGGSVWSIVKQGAGKGNIIVLVASLALIGIHEFSYQETQRYSAELERRKHLSGGQ
ncbi:hypothetical protein [Corallincola spongiicola]|uniref:Uncharacterized protein n=1 Tax=Corallincola spongiicola TaxID=2520508 RepID=A0ABY1WL27_9GAMM|nr:hypothetical protein [Corallincola spongiicola]TAA41029.1 hypothetical protein EXY25_17155 [Corallincola spongiicola]